MIIFVSGAKKQIITGMHLEEVIKKWLERADKAMERQKQLYHNDAPECKKHGYSRK